MKFHVRSALLEVVCVHYEDVAVRLRRVRHLVLEAFAGTRKNQPLPARGPTKVRIDAARIGQLLQSVSTVLKKWSPKAVFRGHLFLVRAAQKIQPWS